MSEIGLLFISVRGPLRSLTRQSRIQPMRAEDTVATSSRYLMLATRLSKQRFESEKVASIEWCEANGSRLNALGQTALAELRSFDLGEDSCAVILYSSYADIPAGRVYDTAFKLSEPSVADRTEAKLRLAILNRRLPLLSLEHGHHHLAVFDFVGGVPEIVTSLPVDHFDGGIGGPLVGLCDAPTWKSILERGRDA